MKSKNYSKLVVLFSIIAIVLSTFTVSAAFSAYSSTLNIGYKAGVNEATWNIKFQNLSAPIINGSALVNEDPILNDTVIKDFDVTLNRPNDSVSYTFYIVNNGDIDAKIGALIKETIICTGTGSNKTADENLVCNNIDYNLKYTGNNTNVKEEDTLKSSESKQIILTLKYNGNSLPVEKVEISGLGISIVYIQE